MTRLHDARIQTSLLVAVLLIPIVVQSVRLVTAFGDYVAGSDNGMTELLVRAVGHHAVLLGPYSRNSWSHPGPAFLYLAAVPYHLLGGNSTALLLVALMVNGAAMALMVVVARRHGGLPFAICVTAVLALYCRAMPGTYLSDPWNPYVIVLPFGACMLCVWATGNGSRWSLAAACGIGTLCVQNHIGYLLPVGALLGYAVVAQLQWVRRREGGLDGRRIWQALRWAMLVLAVLWAPPVYQQLTQYPGNFRSILHYFTHPDEPAQGLREALKVVAAQFTVRADWITGWRGSNPFSGTPTGALEHPRPVLAILVLAAMVFAWWRGQRPERTFATVLAITGVAGTFAASRILGPMVEYRVRWVVLFSALAMAFTAAVAVRVATPWFRRHTRGAIAVTVAGAGLVVLLVVNAGIATGIEPNNLATSSATRRIAPAVLARFGDARRPLVMRTHGGSSDGFWTSLPRVLHDHGVPVRWPDSFDNRLRVGSWNVDTGGPARAVLVAASDAGIDEVATWPHARLVAYHGRLPFARRAAVAAEVRRAVRTQRDRFTLHAVRLEQSLTGDAVFALPPTAANRRA